MAAIPLCAGQPFAGANGKKKSACCVRNDRERRRDECGRLSCTPFGGEFGRYLNGAGTRGKSDATLVLVLDSPGAGEQDAGHRTILHSKRKLAFEK